MFKQIWHRIQSYGRSSKGESLREASKSLDIPKSMIWHQEKRNEERSAEMDTGYWNTAKGQHDLKRMIISVIYTFGIKRGAGAGRMVVG